MKDKLIISSKKYKGETTVLSIRLPVEMVKELNKIAESTGRNRNELVSLCLEYAIRNLTIENDNNDKQ